MVIRGAKPVPEKVEQQHILQLLRSIGAHVYVMGGHRRRGDYQGTMQTEGIPDLMAFLPVRQPRLEGYRFVFIECKAKGGRLRPEQQAFRTYAESAAVAHVVGDLDTVIAWLVEHDFVKATQFPHYRQPKDHTL